MADLELQINKQNRVEFDASIQGIDLKNTEVRFIIEGEGVNLEFKGELKENSVIVDLPIMSGLIKTGTYKSSLEFIVEGEYYFRPMEAVVEFTQPMKLEASIKESKVIDSKPLAKISASAKISVDKKAPKVVESEADEEIGFKSIIR